MVPLFSLLPRRRICGHSIRRGIFLQHGISHCKVRALMPTSLWVIHRLVVLDSDLNCLSFPSCSPGLWSLGHFIWIWTALVAVGFGSINAWGPVSLFRDRWELTANQSWFVIFLIPEILVMLNSSLGHSRTEVTTPTYWRHQFFPKSHRTNVSY